MNLRDPALLDQLAAEYVLGTLRGAARRRFERECSMSTDAMSRVRVWEDRFMEMLPLLEPIAPRSHVWANIAQRIGRNPRPASRASQRWWWGLWGALAVGIVLAVTVRWMYPPLAVVATVAQSAAQPLWQVSRSKDSTVLAVRAARDIAENPGAAFELWALQRDGSAPVSLGLMPRGGSVRRSLSERQIAALMGSDTLAVSVEPLSGSPTGAPTGPVVYTAPLRQTG
jgi:anti-sigma-K factor RskA